MKASDIEKAQEMISEIQKFSNRISGIKKYFKDNEYNAKNRLYIEGENGYFNGFYLTKEETENIMCRLEHERLAMVEKLRELGREMD